MVVPTLAYKNHDILVHKVNSTTTQQLEIPPMVPPRTQFIGNSAVLGYPYLDLQIRSHVHPKFVIGNIGSQLTKPNQAAELGSFWSQADGSARPLFEDPRWISRINTLVTCLKIMGNWRLLETSTTEVTKWQEERYVPSRLRDTCSVTTEGRYQTRSTRSSHSGQTAQGHPSLSGTPLFSSTPNSKATSRSGMQTRGNR